MRNSEFYIRNSALRIGSAYRTIQFPVGSNALWQVVIESNSSSARGGIRNAGLFAILRSALYTPHLDRGCSSVGRAVALQAIGQEFESPQLHQLLNAKC